MECPTPGVGELSGAVFALPEEVHRERFLRAVQLGLLTGHYRTFARRVNSDPLVRRNRCAWCPDPSQNRSRVAPHLLGSRTGRASRLRDFGGQTGGGGPSNDDSEHQGIRFAAHWHSCRHRPKREEELTQSI